MTLRELIQLLRRATDISEIDKYSDEIVALIPETKIMLDFNQQNYAHQYDLWEHSLQTVTGLQKDIEDDMVYLAALVHDIGKPDCQIHKIDNVVFSHAGITESFVMRYFGNGKADLDSMIGKINRMGETELWQDDSPIWARPQYGEMRLYPQDVFQVVGHTPVRTALEEGNLLTLDNFSTYRDGRPIGDERFVWIDTVKKTWKYVEK